jgi:hypothetical protein
MSGHPASQSRRLTSRVETPANVWVDWRRAGREDISRVRNMSLGGLFIETLASRALGSIVKLEFLVQEGQIRADGVVSRGARPWIGAEVRSSERSRQSAPRQIDGQATSIVLIFERDELKAKYDSERLFLRLQLARPGGQDGLASGVFSLTFSRNPS